MVNFAKVFACFFLAIGLFGCGGGGGESKNDQSAPAQDSNNISPPIKVMNCAEKTFIQADFGQAISDPSCSGENKVSV